MSATVLRTQQSRRIISVTSLRPRSAPRRFARSRWSFSAPLRCASGKARVPLGR